MEDLEVIFLNEIDVNVLNDAICLEMLKDFDELAISAPYKIEEYNACSHLWLDDVGQSINLNMSYDKIKEIIQDLNHYCS